MKNLIKRVCKYYLENWWFPPILILFYSIFWNIVSSVLTYNAPRSGEPLGMVILTTNQIRLFLFMSFVFILLSLGCLFNCLRHHWLKTLFSLFIGFISFLLIAPILLVVGLSTI